MNRTGRQPIDVCAAVVEQRQRFLLARRPPGSHLAGCWEFPGGKCHAGETLTACIVREIQEELGVTVADPQFLTTIAHDYPEKSIRLHFLRCHWPEGAVPHPRDGQEEANWFTLTELEPLDLAPADRRFVTWLKSQPMRPPATFHLRTYGCQMNERDSEALSCLLETHGFCPVRTESEADILLYNTCSVRDQAERKAIGKLGLLKRLKRTRPELVIGVIGCMAQRRGSELLAELPHVDLVLGTDQLPRLPELLREILDGRRGIVAVDPDSTDMERLCLHRPGQVSAHVAVMRGCNQHCSYCVVPAVRGREKSRSVAEIVTEVAGLARQGVKEIVLLGQNITAYGVAEARRAGRYQRDLSPFAELLRAVHEVDGIRRIRFTSPHPNYMNAAFVRAVAELPKVCDSFHIPVQSGADRILRLMHRGYTAEEYLARIAALRAVRPDATFSTDVIVGFPGETDAEFAATRALMQQVGYDMAYIFKYSPRPGTSATRLLDPVPQEIKEQRLALLLEDLEVRVKAQNERFLGRDLEVLVEGPSARNPQRWSGRAGNNKVLLFAPRPGVQAGDFVSVQVDRTTAHSLFGEIVNRDAQCVKRHS